MNKQVFSHLDDAYTTSIYRDNENNVHIVVEADILIGGDPTMVEAEANRRMKMYMDMIKEMLNRSP